MTASPLVGVAYQARSKNMSLQRCINLYLESMEAPGGTVPRGLLGCPGLLLSVTLGNGPVRAMFPHNGYLYVVSGNTAYKLNNQLIAQSLGTLNTSSGQAYILANATQVAFFDSQGLHVYTPATDGFATATLPYSGPVGVPTYIDGLALLTEPGSFRLWQSGINDFTSWPALTFTTEDGNSENVVAIVAVRDQVIVFKEYSMCFYTNAGLNGFVFQRLEGTYPDRGCLAARSVAVVNDVPFWLGVTENGGPKFYMLQGYEPVEVSTYAIENEMIGYTTVLDCTGYSTSQEGHDFYVASFPQAGKTWVVDLKETLKLKYPVWHQRAGWSNGKFTQYAGICSAQFGGAVYMGDYQNGNVYLLDLNTHTDNGAVRKWLRSWRANEGPTSYQTSKVNYLNIQMNTGSDVDPNISPLMMFRQSLDSGHNWGTERQVPAGNTGQKAINVNITRLGATKRGLNGERYFELSSTDSFRPELLGAVIG